MMDEVADLKQEALAAIQADEAASDAAAAAANGAAATPTNDASQATAATVAKYQDKVAKSVAAHSDVLTLLEAKQPEAAAQWDALRESINEAAEYEKGGPEVFAAASPRLASLLAKAEETEKALQATVEEARASGESLTSPEWKAKTVDAVVQALDEAKASSEAKAAVAAYEQAMAQASGAAAATEGGAIASSFAARPGAVPAPVMNEGDLEPIGGGSSLVAPSAGATSEDAAPLEMVAVGAREANPAKPTVDFLATLPKDVVAGWGADTVTKYLAAVASAAKVPLESVDITAVSTEADAVDTRVTFQSKKDAESWVSKLKEGDDASGLGAATAAAGLGTATATDVLLVGAGYGAATGEDKVTPAAAPNAGSAKLSTGAIAGIAVGSAAGLALIAAVVVALARRRRY